MKLELEKHENVDRFIIEQEETYKKGKGEVNKVFEQRDKGINAKCKEVKQFLDKKDAQVQNL